MWICHTSQFGFGINRMWSETKKGEKKKKKIGWVWQRLVDFLAYLLIEVCDAILSFIPRNTPSDKVSHTSKTCRHKTLVHLWDGYDYRTDRWECESCGADIPEVYGDDL